MTKGWLLGGLVLMALMVGGCRKEVAMLPPKAVPVREDGGLELNLATFNIRNDNNDRDRDDRTWTRRTANAVRLIRRMSPDVLGMQEVTHGQAADLRASLPDYEFYGRARDDGERKGEYAAIFYRSDRFTLDRGDCGMFWLSSTPEVPGSMTWGNTFPRVVTWVRLLDRGTGRGFYVFNTHLDHQHQGSREEAALLIAKRIDQRKRPEEPVVLLGDFNAVSNNPALSYLTGKSSTLAGRGLHWKNGLIDAYQALHPSEKNQVTLHLWNGNGGGRGWKVDHILVAKGARVIDASIVMDVLPFSSDHFPVTARVVFPQSPR